MGYISEWSARNRLKLKMSDVTKELPTVSMWGVILAVCSKRGQSRAWTSTGVPLLLASRSAMWKPCLAKDGMRLRR